MTTMEKLEEAWELVHDALEVAENETESWETIEAWQDLDEDNQVIMKRSKQYDCLYWVFLEAPDKEGKLGCEESFSGTTRPKALKSAARYCREEMAK